jgi:DNA-binding NtrC family response regulator
VQRAIRLDHAVFLDELQAVDAVAQHVLLPLLDSPRRTGGHSESDRPLSKPLYVILATNQDVTDRAWREQFRQDLWYRISGYHLQVPSVAARGPEVTYRYLKMFLERHDVEPEQAFRPDALSALARYHWPGNLREIQAFVERVASHLRIRGQNIGVDDLAQLGIGPADPIPLARRVAPDPGPSADVLDAEPSGATRRASKRCSAATRSWIWCGRAAGPRRDGPPDPPRSCDTIESPWASRGFVWDRSSWPDRSDRAAWAPSGRRSTSGRACASPSRCWGAARGRRRTM